MTSAQMMDVQLTERDAGLLVTIIGELDLATAPLLHERLAGIDWEGFHRVVLDLEGVTFIDSSGLGAVIALHKEHPETEIVLVSSDRSVVAKVLELTAMRDLFAIHPSTEAALAET